MELVDETMDEINEIKQEGGEELTIDQRIAIAQVRATLSVAQELSCLNPQNSSYRDKDAELRNGWGLLTRDGKL
jgi:hypothetical protein